MLPPFIIEQIRRRERRDEARREAERPRVELPIDIYPSAPEPAPKEEQSDRGVVILQL